MSESDDSCDDESTSEVLRICEKATVLQKENLVLRDKI